jgi:hypothetical protein
VVRPGDTEAFVQQVSALLASGPEAGLIGRRARTYAEQNFSSAAVCRRFLQILDCGAGVEQGSTRPLATLSATPRS